MGRRQSWWLLLLSVEFLVIWFFVYLRQAVVTPAALISAEPPPPLPVAEPPPPLPVAEPPPPLPVAKPPPPLPVAERSTPAPISETQQAEHSTPVPMSKMQLVNLSLPADVPRWLCISGEPYGRTGNQLLTIGYSLSSARGRGWAGVQVNQACDERSHAGDCGPVLPWRDEVEMPTDLVFGSAVPCTETETWETLYWKQNAVRGDPRVALIRPSHRVRLEAERAWPANGTRLSVHGRSLEGVCPITEPICPSRRTQVADRLCDYSWGHVAGLGLHLPPDAVPRLFTDGQNRQMDTTYAVIDDHPFMVQLWMMVLSDVHVGNTQSSIDYMIWLWKQQEGQRHGVMYPRDCYVGPTDW